MERLFAVWLDALSSVDFFKTRQPELVMRSLREVLFRAQLDEREAALIRAMGIEVGKFIERQQFGSTDLDDPNDG